MQPYLLPAVSALIASVTSQAGISGAFLLLPFQISVLGINSPVASSTNLFYNVISTPSGIYRYKKEKRLNIGLSAIILTGTIPGMLTGSYIRATYLSAEKFKIFVGIVLLYMSFRLLLSKSKKYSVTEISDCNTTFKSLKYTFDGKVYKVRTLPLILTAYLVGIVAGAYGVGGGAFLAPLLITFFSLPIYTVSGAVLLSTFVTSCLCSAFYGFLGYPPNLKVGFLLGIGGLIGMYFGAMLQKKVSEKIIKRILGLIVILIGLKYIWAGIF